jgi:hypothetical protein
MNTKIKGIIVQYTSHPAVVCGEDWLYTRDYVHMLTEYLKQRYGKDTVIVYMNGAQGNQVAADPYKPFITGFDEADRVGKGLGEGAARIIDRILAEGTLARDVPLRASETSVDLPIRKISREETDRARLMLLSCKKGAQLHGLDPRVEAESILEMAELVQTEESTLIQAVCIGDVLILTFPGEVFLEHAQNSLCGHPFKDAMIFGLANDYVGYIPTKEAFGQGGYEVKTSYSSSRFEPCAGELLTKACRELINNLYNVTGQA